MLKLGGLKKPNPFGILRLTEDCCSIVFGSDAPGSLLCGFRFCFLMDNLTKVMISRSELSFDMFRPLQMGQKIFQV